MLIVTPKRSEQESNVDLGTLGVPLEQILPTDRDSKFKLQTEQEFGALCVKLSENCIEDENVVLNQEPPVRVSLVGN